jgi:hypothetical protein
MEDRRVGKYARICSAVSISLGILGGAAGSLAAEPDCPPRSCSPLVNENGGRDCPNTHNMMVVGNGTVFLSHLPMFGGLNKRGDTYRTPHRFQVILEATFAKNGGNVQSIYTRDREANPSVMMYTLNPECFVLSDLFPSGSQTPSLSSFKGTVFRGHLERGGRAIGQLEDVDVVVKNVIHARMFDPSTEKPDRLTYILFGKGQDLFLAHWISKPPDFDQLMSVSLEFRPFSDDELDRGIEVVFRERPDSSASRLRKRETLTGRGHVTGAHQFLDLKVSGGTEFYFEEGELFVPPTFEPTKEEQRSGFGK